MPFYFSEQLSVNSNGEGGLFRSHLAVRRDTYLAVNRTNLTKLMSNYLQNL